MRRRTRRQQGPIKFDVLKARVQRAFAWQLQSLADDPQDCAARFPGLLGFLRLLARDHPELTMLVETLAQAAAPVAPRQEKIPIGAQDPVDQEELLAQARAYGMRCIGQWDVRCVVSLVRCFPQCNGARSRPRHAVCWIADDPSGHWVVSFASHSRCQRRNQERPAGRLDLPGQRARSVLLPLTRSGPCALSRGRRGMMGV